MSMKAKLFVCDSDASYKSVHSMFTSKSYKECTAFDIAIEDVEVDCDSTHFNKLALMYHLEGERIHSPKKRCGFCSWQNFLLKFENDEFAELRRSEDVLYRHDDCTANWNAIKRFREDVAAAIAGKPDVVFSEDEDFIV